MKIAGGKKVEVRESVVLPVFRGLGHVRPLCFNPTKAQMEELGHPYPKDDKYLVDGKMRLVLLCEYNPNKNFKGKAKVAYPEKMFTTISFNLENKVVVSQKGSTKFINGGGKTSYVKSESDLQDWFDKTNVRPARVGEEELYRLLMAISSVVGTKENPLTNFPLSDDKSPEEVFDDILTGDMTLLNNLLEDKDENGNAFEDEVFTNVVGEAKEKLTRMINVIFYENEYNGNLYQKISNAFFAQQNSSYMGKNDKERFASGELDKNVKFTNLAFREVTQETIDQEAAALEERLKGMKSSSIEEAPDTVDDSDWNDNDDVAATTKAFGAAPATTPDEFPNDWD